MSLFLMTLLIHLYLLFTVPKLSLTIYCLAVNWHLYLTGQPIRKPLPSLPLLLVNNSTPLYTVQCTVYTVQHGRSPPVAAVNHFHAVSPRCSVYCPEQGNPRRRGRGGY